MDKQWTPEEQKAHRKLWIDALRSGTYRQARTELRNKNGFCCLGVACDVSGLGKWADQSYAVDGEPPAGGFLPLAVRDWLGLHDEAGRSWDGKTPALYQLNDRHRKSFAEIADVIEVEPEGLIAQTGAA